MNKWTLKYALALITLILSNNFSIAFTDNYPKNPKIDALNNTFKIDLSDKTDKIICEVEVDIRFNSR